MFDLFSRGFGLLTDEFQSYVEGFGFGPARVGSESADAFDEAGDPVSDGVGDVESDEEAHWERELQLSDSGLKGSRFQSFMVSKT